MAAPSETEQRSASPGDVLTNVGHRPTPLPQRPWVMQQRWNDLLFAHWPMPVAAIQSTLPEGLVADTFDGSAWLGVVPFGMDRVRVRGVPALPGARAFPELNLRTYVREKGANRAGVYFYSLEAGNPLAVLIARTAFRLPYYWAWMSMRTSDEPGRTPVVHYRSRRLFSAHGARFRARYRGLGALAEGPLEQFLTARYALYTANRRGRVFRGDIHHLPWPLERAEAEFELNELPAANGFTLPDCSPVLHYSRELLVYVWAIEPARGNLMASLQSVPQAAPAGAPAASIEHHPAALRSAEAVPGK